MAFIGALTDPNTGAGWNAQGPQLLRPFGTTAQSDQLYGQAQQGIGQQQALIQALEGQNAIGTQSNNLAQQQQLAGQLQNQANGQGPNPVQAQLAQNTSANTANQAALMAGQRGVGSNAGLLARQAAQQGGANQQQAVGQAATLGAQQQLAAQQALMAQQAQIGQNSANQTGQLANAVSGGQQATQNEQQNVLNSIAQLNNAQVGVSSNMNEANSRIAQGNQQAQAGMFGQMLGGIGTVLGLAQGGEVPGYADGGSIMPAMQSGPQSGAGKFLQGFNQNNQGGPNGIPSANGFKDTELDDSVKKGTGKLMGGLGKIGGGGASSSGGGGMMTAGGGDALGGGAAAGAGGDAAILAASKGGHVPGKAKVHGDSYSNDNVPAMLSPGEIVIPRHISQGPNAAENSKRFVQAIMSRR